MRRAMIAKLAVSGALLAVSLIGASSATAADPAPGFIPPTADWLTTVNYYRAMAGLGPVSNNAAGSEGAYNHSCYMLYNGISHDEVPGKLGYTTSGDAAGNAGNVAVSSVQNTSARSHIELWMTGPFHAIGILRYNLGSVSFGKCDSSTTSPWKSGATLNVISGLGSGTRPSNPILFPGNGTTTNLSKFVTESPNPLTYCGWTGSAGLPVIAMMPEPVTSASATMTGPDGPVQTCRLFSGNTDGTAKAILGGDNAVTVVPRNQLSPGTYTVTVTTQARTVTWSFTVDPAAATGVMPVPQVTPSAAASRFQPITPFRFADSRENQRITPVQAGVPKTIQVGGVAGLPSDATAVSANITVVAPNGSSYLTVYNCAGAVPTASTLNFHYNTMANSGLFPLNASGQLCVFSPVSTQLVIDINGYFRTSATGSLTTTAPIRVLTANDVAPQTFVRKQVAGVGGIPSSATAVAVNLVAWNPKADGYLTAYPCDVARPLVSNLNPEKDISKANLAIVPLSSTGELCVYTHVGTGLQIDVIGWFTSSGGAMSPTSPTRLTDTRDPYRTEMNAGTGGVRINAGQTVTLQYGGVRGIPSTAKALSLNVAVTGEAGNGMLTVWPCGNRPNTASMTFMTSTDTANAMQSKLSSSGTLCVYSTATTHVVIDVNGWWT